MGLWSLNDNLFSTISLTDNPLCSLRILIQLYVFYQDICSAYLNKSNSVVYYEIQELDKDTCSVCVAGLGSLRIYFNDDFLSTSAEYLRLPLTFCYW